MTDSELMRVGDGVVESSDGWVVRLINPELFEYSSGAASCLVNVDYSPERRARRIYASESASELFPCLHEHMRSAARLLGRCYVVV
ncbi:MAG TPA: hypothetical protein VF169_26095 [Albitalea sp.]|uniref:hypothetical protein n=1 Tax=Piscinibacter sp. TaxID=1903157 RepID=UPI002ED4725D